MMATRLCVDVVHPVGLAIRLCNTQGRLFLHP